MGKLEATSIAKLGPERTEIFPANLLGRISVSTLLMVFSEPCSSPLLVITINGLVLITSIRLAASSRTALDGTAMTTTSEFSTDSCKSLLNFSGSGNGISGRYFVFCLLSFSSRALWACLVHIQTRCPFESNRRARAVPHPPPPRTPICILVPYRFLHQAG